MQLAGDTFHLLVCSLGFKPMTFAFLLQFQLSYKNSSIFAHKRNCERIFVHYKLLCNCVVCEHSRVTYVYDINAYTRFFLNKTRV